MQIRAKTNTAPVVLSIALLLVCLFPVMSIAYNKVVVIPMEGESEPLEPFAPLAAPSPPLNSYSDIGSSVVDKVTGLEFGGIDVGN